MVPVDETSPAAADVAGEAALTGDTPRLAVLKALGDDTRYAIYLELARSPLPLSTADIARSLGLHANTVRPHLERMRDLGLLELRVDARGGIGRPQHLYSTAPEAPSLGLEPPAYPRLARMLLRLAVDAGLSEADALDAGREQGRADAALRPGGGQGLDALVGELALLGFDPEVVPDTGAPGEGAEHAATIGFMHCPYRELAETQPLVVCGLHHGLVDGFCNELGALEVREFRTLVARDGCQVDVQPVWGTGPTESSAETNRYTSSTSQEAP